MSKPNLKTEASDQILASFISHDGVTHNFKTSGRGTSILGSLQGDHVTAYGLIKRGITHSFTNVVIRKAEDLDQIRVRRDEKLFPYLSAITCVNERFQDDFVEDLEKIMTNYNNGRFKKTYLNRLKAIEQSYPDGDENKEALTDTIEKAYIGNCHAMCRETEEITRSLLTHYNHVPNTTFPKDPNNPDTHDERSALDRLDSDHKVASAMIKVCQEEIEKQEKEIEDARNLSSSSRRTRKNNPELLGNNLDALKDSLIELKKNKLENQISDIKELFFYPRISDEDHEINSQIAKDPCSLREWQKENNFSQLARPRTNDNETLSDVVARHIFISFAAYPELKENQDQMISGFTDLVAQDWRMRDVDREILKTNVTKKVIDLEDKARENDILLIPGIRSRRSSRDEQEESEKDELENSTKLSAGPISDRILRERNLRDSSQSERK